MTLMSEITRVSNNIAAAYTALDGKGATLPAAGSQNSANLADTIDSIPTGGGGTGGFDPSVFNAKVSELNSVLKLATGESSSDAISRAVSAGFTRKYHNSNVPYSPYWYVLQFAEGTPYARFYARGSGDSMLFWAPSDVAIYSGDGLGRTDNLNYTSGANVEIVFDFTQAVNNIIVLAIPAVNSGDPLLSLIKSLLSSETSGYGSTPIHGLCACHIYLPSWDRFTMTSSNAIGETWLNYWYRLKSLQLLSCDPFSSSAQKITSIAAIDSEQKIAFSLTDTSFFAQVFDSSVFDATLGVFEKPSQVSLDSSYTLYSIFQGASWRLTHTVFPFKLDFSDYTFSSEVKFSTSSSIRMVSTADLPPIRMYITLPNANVDMRVPCATVSSGVDTPNLDYTSWQYLAEHAPTVTGKTLKIGRMYKMFNLASSSILSTLTNKGWTVVSGE